MDSIINRRSIRQFDGKGVDQETLEYLIKMGMQAPSSHNQRPWQFLIIDDKEQLLHIAQTHPYAKMMETVGAAILVCGDLNRLKHDNDFWQQDCAAVTENILIAATDKGLGSVWVGMYPKVDLISWAIETYHLPEGILPFALVGLGYKAEVKVPRDYMDLTRIHYNKWLS